MRPRQSISAHAAALVALFATLGCRSGEKGDGPKVRIVFRDYPLDFHPDAHLSAEAAREVFAQKGSAAFWKYQALSLQSQHTQTQRRRRRG